MEKYIKPTEEQMKVIQELANNGTLSIALRDVEMNDTQRLNIVGEMFDYSDSGVFSEKVLSNEYQDSEIIDYLKDETEVTIEELIKAYKLSKQEKREVICDFLGVNYLTTNEEISELIKDFK